MTEYFRNISKEEATRLFQSLTLSALQRQILELYYIERLTMAEVAKITGKSRSFVSGELKTIRNKLAKSPVFLDLQPFDIKNATEARVVARCIGIGKNPDDYNDRRYIDFCARKWGRKQDNAAIAAALNVSLDTVITYAKQRKRELNAVEK